MSNAAVNILRVFPRKTAATPDDPLCHVGMPTYKFLDSKDLFEAHVSVTFTYDIPKAEQIAERIAKTGVYVKVGGPAYGDRMSPIFIPGLYIKRGYTITSRGCPTTFKADGHTIHDYEKRFAAEDAGQIPTDRMFKWAMLDPEYILKKGQVEGQTCMFGGGNDAGEV